MRINPRRSNKPINDNKYNYFDGFTGRVSIKPSPIAEKLYMTFNLTIAVIGIYQLIKQGIAKNEKK